MRQLRHFIKTDKYSRNFKCSHCGQELGDGDTYDLMKAHINSCSGKAARAYRKARDDESKESGGFGPQEW